MDFTEDFDDVDYGRLLLGGGGLASDSKDEHERKFMSMMNFTDEMYEIIQDDEDVAPPQHPCMDSTMHTVGQHYRLAHGYISLVVCIAGILMNILIIMVLTRKEMNSPINRMLTALAIADCLVMIEYIPFALHMYVLDMPEEEQYSYAWAVFVLFHSHFTQVLHTINIQLTISMSIWRYVALKGAGKTSNYLTFTRCNLCILIAYITPIIICIPNYLTFSIYHFERLYLKTPFHIILNRKEVSHMKNFLKLCQHTSEIMNIPMDCQNVVVKQNWYTVGLSRMAKANNELLHRINFWIFSVLVKLIPCVVLTFFMCWLVNALYKTKRRYKMLQTTKQLAIVLEADSTSNFSRKKRTRFSGRSACNSNGNGAGGCAENSSVMLQEIALLHPQSQSQSQSQFRRDQRMSCPNTSLTPISDYDGDDDDGSCGDQETTHLQLCGESLATSSSFLHPLSTSPNTSIMTMNGSCSNVPSLLEVNGVCGGGSSSQINVDSSNEDGSNPNAITAQPRVLVSKKKFSRRNLTRVSSLRGIGKGQGRCHRQSSAPAVAVGAGTNGTNHAPVLSSNSAAASIMRNNSKKVVKRTDRTSKLLIAVLCLFLITEIPQGIMAFLSGVYGEQFFKKCYNTWAEVWDILALINSAINFILYCFMSRQFRLQFHMLFQMRRWFKPKWINNMGNCNMHQTISTTV